MTQKAEQSELNFILLGRKPLSKILNKLPMIVMTQLLT